MPLDPSIFGMANRPTTALENPMDAMGKQLQLQSLMRQNQMGDLQYKQAQIDAQDQEKIRSLAQSGKFQTPDQLADAAMQAGVSPKIAIAMKMQGAEHQQKVAATAQALATAAQRNGAAAKERMDLLVKGAEEGRTLSFTAKSPQEWQEGLARIDAKYSSLGVPSLVQKYGDFTPANVNALALNGATMVDAHASAFGQNMSTPGGIQNIKQPLLPGQAPVVTQLTKNAQSPVAKAQADFDAGLIDKATLDKMVAKETHIAPPMPMGVQVGGGTASPDPSKRSSRAEQIANGEIPVPKPTRGDSNALRDVADARQIMIERGLDPQDLPGLYGSKKTGQESFAAGKPNARIITAINTASDHTGKILKPAAEALKNGDWQTANRIGNAIGVNLGKNEATNFDSVATFLATEVAKVASGGGQPTLSEIAEARKMFPTNGSNAQIQGAIDIANRIMAGKLSALDIEHKNAFNGQSILDKKRLSPEAIRNVANAGGDQPAASPTSTLPKTMVKPGTKTMYYLHPDGNYYLAPPK